MPRLRALLVTLASTLALAGPAQAAFPGANGKIAFASNRDGHHQIFVMERNGSNQRNVSNSVHFDFAPTWSPDGKSIAFERLQNVNGNFEGSSVWVMRADGAKQRQVTFDGQSGTPAWSPDGRELVYVRHVGTDSELFKVGSKGGTPTQLTDNEPSQFDEAADRSPAWSPDGTQIAWEATRFTGFTQPGNGVYVMNADGTGETLLASTRGGRHPDWSPDSTRILFDCGILCVVKRDGSGFAPIGLGPQIRDGGAGVWSPDGTMVSLVSRLQTPPHDADVFIANADGSGVTNLTQHPAEDTVPSWQPVKRQKPKL